MHALTCAHRELPFGTVVKVTNVANGKSVRCVVNDRGPFVSGRDIDLSYAAAREIGLSSTGPVTVEYLERDMRYVKEIGYAAGAKGPFTVQVGAFREKDNARRLKESLDLKYKEVYISEATIDNTTLYRVRIGKFSDKKKAYRLAKTLADEGYSPLVTHYDEQI
jgi:rare lipoprotein A